MSMEHALKEELHSTHGARGMVIAASLVALIACAAPNPPGDTGVLGGVEGHRHDDKWQGHSRYRGSRLPPPFTDGMFVGRHGSWNRALRSGYKVIFVPFSGGAPSGAPIAMLTGFVKENGAAMGRPVGVAVNNRDALLVADDVGRVIRTAEP